MPGRPWRLSRRSFLRWALAAGAGAGGMGTLWPRWSGRRAMAASGPETRTATYTLSSADLTRSLDDTPDHALTSPVWATPFAFNAVAARWRGASPAGDPPPRAEFRVYDGGAWTRWVAAGGLHGLDAAFDSATDLVAATGTAVQVRFRSSRESLTPPPPPEQIAVTIFDSQSGPTAEEAELTASQFGDLSIDALIVNPNQIGRPNWGANENYRYKDGREIWFREYKQAQKIIIHHTVTVNNPPDPAGWVRSIYQYHAVTLGWGDIGYNFLVDHTGRVYEGRAGGVNAQGLPVVAGHALQYNAGSLGIAVLGAYDDPAAPLPDAAARALANLVSYKAVQHGIHPTGSGFFVDKTLPNIMGHRDCLSTACPGDTLYALVPSIRDQALANLPPLGQSWVRQQFPPIMAPGSVASGIVTVRNSGSKTWSRSGANPFRIGYHWYRADGQEVRESAIEIHSDLPKDVAPGQEIAVPMRVQAPSSLGTFTLKIDMLQEGKTWLSSVQGNESLALSVLVASEFKYQTRLPWVTSGR